jgi:hypothetical protein
MGAVLRAVGRQTVCYGCLGDRGEVSPAQVRAVVARLSAERDPARAVVFAGTRCSLCRRRRVTIRPPAPRADETPAIVSALLHEPDIAVCASCLALVAGRALADVGGLFERLGRDTRIACGESSCAKCGRTREVVGSGVTTRPPGRT